MDTGGELVLASRWSVSWDVARLVFAAFHHSLPEWVRYPLLALGCTVVVHLGLDRLRERFGAPLEEGGADGEGGEAVRESGADVR
ncbi:hypothetical protein GCM10010275_59170 [Streptomyces litmocidini]|uniref:hypothetical protein n=1 Tax=Streptomyces litmocidini TaxID=67318 RepID=UPI00167C9947|nr:hypothetical protein [Streptomyces litmocidini]GGV10458.1 hypothetical protein GCM10010275_59170 [Streptomyces litmocidini]